MIRSLGHRDDAVATFAPAPLAPLHTRSSCKRAWKADENFPGFESFSGAIRRELAPEGTLEALVVDRLILSAWQLARANRAEAAAVEKDARRWGKALDALRADASDARRTLGEAFALLQALRDSRRPQWGQPPAPEPAAVAGPAFEEDDDVLDARDERGPSDEWPIAARDGIDDEEAEFGDEPEGDDAPSDAWRDRLVYDFNISETSPVVRGTWVTVGQVVTRIVDGWTWGDILRTHPELTEDDIRACLAFTIAQDNGDA